MDSVVAWMAWLFALVAISLAPQSGEIAQLRGRIVILEQRTCTMMVVNTPSGEATICSTRMGK